MKAGDNNTFQSKQIYKDLYDFSENGKNYDTFQNNRKNKLASLPKIDKDKTFSKKVPQRTKLNQNLSENSEKVSSRQRMINFDKEKFFRGNKNVFYEDSNVVKITHNVDMNRRGEAAEENKEKNMRNKLYTTKNVDKN